MARFNVDGGGWSHQKNCHFNESNKQEWDIMILKNRMLRKTIFVALLSITFSNYSFAEEVKNMYDRGCAACHNTGAAGAPKLGDASAWNIRLSERKKEGLYASAIKGRGAMPPKGLCQQCSDDEIKTIVDYMVSMIEEGK